MNIFFVVLASCGPGEHTKGGVSVVLTYTTEVTYSHSPQAPHSGFLNVVEAMVSKLSK